MTYCCITCEFDKARANNAPGRRNMRPMIPPVAATRTPGNQRRYDLAEIERVRAAS